MSRQDQIDFIQRALALTGWSQTLLAKRAGLDPSTLSRFLGTESSSHALRHNTLRRISEATGIPMRPGKSANPPHDLAEEGDEIKLEVDSEVDALRAALNLHGRDVQVWRMNGRSLEQAGYRSGDYLFVSPHDTALAGDAVSATLYNSSQGTGQVIFRLYHPPFLVAAGGDPGSYRPLSIGSDADVTGVIVASYRARKL